MEYGHIKSICKARGEIDAIAKNLHACMLLYQYASKDMIERYIRYGKVLEMKSSGAVKWGN